MVAPSSMGGTLAHSFGTLTAHKRAMVEEKVISPDTGDPVDDGGKVVRSLELRFSRELALGVCCIAWLTAAIKGETFLVIDGANDSSAASRHKKRLFSL